jgi:hypothetical protein
MMILQMLMYFRSQSTEKYSQELLTISYLRNKSLNSVNSAQILMVQQFLQTRTSNFQEWVHNTGAISLVMVNPANTCTTISSKLETTGVYNQKHS